MGNTADDRPTAGRCGEDVTAGEPLGRRTLLPAVIDSGTNVGDVGVAAGSEPTAASAKAAFTELAIGPSPLPNELCRATGRGAWWALGRRSGACSGCTASVTEASTGKPGKPEELARAEPGVTL